MAKKHVKEYYHPTQIALSQEVSQHPELRLLLTQYGPTQYEEMLGEIAAYVGIGVNGVYTEPELHGLYEQIIEKLRKKRAPEIILNS